MEWTVYLRSVTEAVYGQVIKRVPYDIPNH